MLKTIGVICLLIFLYFLVSTMVSAGICHDTNIHKFKHFGEDCSFPDLDTPDDKFIFFTEFVFWPFIVVFYYIPKVLFNTCKFLINYLGWIIAKLFKL